MQTVFDGVFFKHGDFGLRVEEIGTWFCFWIRVRRIVVACWALFAICRSDLGGKRRA